MLLLPTSPANGIPHGGALTIPTLWHFARAANGGDRQQKHLLPVHSKPAQKPLAESLPPSCLRPPMEARRRETLRTRKNKLDSPLQQSRFVYIPLVNETKIEPNMTTTEITNASAAKTAQPIQGTWNPNGKAVKIIDIRTHSPHDGSKLAMPMVLCRLWSTDIEPGWYSSENFRIGGNRI